MLDSNARKCYKAVLIVGPGSEYGYNTLKSKYDREDCLIIGDGVRDISLEEIEAALKDKVDHNTRIDVELHSRITKDENDVYHHFLNLNYKSTGNTTRSEDLVAMLDQCSTEPLSIELRCCYGGMVKNTLKPGSALITHSHWGEFFFEDVGAHSLSKLLDDHFQSESKPILDRITDNLPAYAINPVKISIVSTDGAVVDYTIRHAKQLIIGPTNFLNWHMGEYYKHFNDLIEEESMNLSDNPAQKLPELTPEESEDYIYGSIVYQRDLVILLKFYKRLLDKHPDVLRSLLRKKIGRHDLVLHALDENQIEVIKFITQNLDKLIEDITDPNERTSAKNNLLNRIYRHAIKKENTELVKILLASPNSAITMLDGESLLIYAISRKYDTIAQMLIEEKVGLNKPNLKGLRAIDALINQMVALDGDLKEARIDRATFEVRGKVNLQMLKAMLKASVNVDSKGPDGLTPIFRAVELNDPELLKSLLARSLMPDQICNKESLLDYAIRLRKEKVVMQLCNNMAMLSSVSVAEDVNERATTLSWAAQQGLDALVSAMLASTKTASSDLIIPNKLGNTPLILAVMKGCTKVVSAMVASDKIDDEVLNIQDSSGSTALAWAVKLNQKGIVDIMLASGKIKDATDLPNKEGKSALMLALELGHNDIAAALIRAKVGINTPDKEGTTPLMLAAVQDKLSLVKALIRIGADQKLKDREGFTALDLAVQADNKDIVNKLTPQAVTFHESKPPSAHVSRLAKAEGAVSRRKGSFANTVPTKKDLKLKPLSIHADAGQASNRDSVPHGR